MYFIARIFSVCYVITVQQTLTHDKHTDRTGYDTHIVRQPILAGTISSGRTGGSPGAQREKLLYTEDEKISLCLEFRSE